MTNLDWTFYSAKSFVGNGLGHWATESVTSMRNTFADATSFHPPTDDDTKGFRYVVSPRDINKKSGLSQWDTRSLELLHYTFDGALLWDGDLSRWDVSHVKRMDGVFRKAIAWTGGNMSRWNTKKVRLLAKNKMASAACVRKA